APKSTRNAAILRTPRPGYDVRLMSALYLSGTVGDRFCVWPLETERTGLGRSSRNTIQIVDSTVSKEHAEIARQGDRYTVRDLGSRNGTRVNGVDVTEPVPIRIGDRVEI